MRIAFALMLALSLRVQADWKATLRENPDGPGNAVDIIKNDRLVGRLVYGKGQIKPYLHVFGESGEALTNGGADENGKAAGAFPHHRGIFIGWKIQSELGTDDLWHMTRGCKMELDKIEQATGGSDKARIVATVLWRSARSTNGSDLLITERRDLAFSRAGNKTQIDAVFTLAPARDLRLAGDLQHSGVHFRASNEVHGRTSETSYLTAPGGKSKGSDLQWCSLRFPVGTNFYSALQLNHPSNPVEELSTRNYGRFGYFFRKALVKGEPLTLKYRFLIGREPWAENPDERTKEAEAAFRAFAK